MNRNEWNYVASPFVVLAFSNTVSIIFFGEIQNSAYVLAFFL